MQLLHYNINKEKWILRLTNEILYLHSCVQAVHSQWFVYSQSTDSYLLSVAITKTRRCWADLCYRRLVPSWLFPSRTLLVRTNIHLVCLYYYALTWVLPKHLGFSPRQCLGKSWFHDEGHFIWCSKKAILFINPFLILSINIL